jgi:hypothetical protein
LPDEVEARLAAALEGANRSVATVELARALRDEGMSQLELYRLFSTLQQRLEGDDPRYDAVVDTMDLIWSGAWAKGHGLFAQALTEDRIKDK